MALTITKQPASNGLYFADSPILIEMISTQVAQTGFAYKLEVTIWSGGISDSNSVTYTLRKLPNPENSNRALFDVSKLIQDQLEHPTAKNFTARVEDIGTGGIWCKITAKATWGSSGSESTAGNTWYNTQGYTFMDKERVNETIAVRDMLMIRPTDTEVYGSTYIPVLRSDFDQVIVTAGSETHTQTLTASATESDTRIQYVDVYDIFEDEITGSYDEFKVKLSDGTNESSQYTFYVGCESRFVPIPIMYLNQYGVIETLFLEKKHVRSRSYERISFKRAHIIDSVDIDMSRKGNTTFNVTSQVSHVMNTGFLDEAENTMIEQLMISPYIVAKLDDVWRQVVVNDMELQEKTSRNDRLIQYSISLTEGHKEINIVR